MEKELPELTPEDLRVLGTLMEKSKTTPDYYPMTLNALTAGCNQKTSRKPVVEYDEPTVVMSLNRLKGRDLVSTAVGGGNRAVKYKHNFLTRYPVSDAEQAILCLLFLRGPQTPGELNTNSGRLHEFSSLESVQETLNGMSRPGRLFVKELSRRPGQKEARYVHLFGGEISQEEEVLSAEPARPSAYDLEARVSAMEKELAEVKDTLAKLVKELGG